MVFVQKVEVVTVTERVFLTGAIPEAGEDVVVLAVVEEEEEEGGRVVDCLEGTGSEVKALEPDLVWARGACVALLR